MSGVGSRETGLDSLFASKPVGPGFEPCLGQSAKLAGAPKPLCLSGTGRQEDTSHCATQSGSLADGFLPELQIELYIFTERVTESVPNTYSEYALKVVHADCKLAVECQVAKTAD